MLFMHGISVGNLFFLFQSGTFLVDPGSCRDQLLIQYVDDDVNPPRLGPWFNVDGPQTYLAPGSKVNLKLVTCLRVKVDAAEVPRLYVEYDLAGGYTLAY